MKQKNTTNDQPLHPSAAFYAQSGFFKGIKNWGELHAKISKLNNENTTTQGNAFEVFAEMYLKVIKKSSKVIPQHCFTTKLKKKFHYPTTMPDAGADGLYLAENGQWTSYQAKHRSDQKTLTWGELGTFFGVSEYTPMRHVITSCQEIVATVDEMKGHDGRFSSTREEDLNRLTEEDFELMAKWLEGVSIEREPAKPYEYQQKAINNICKALKRERRTQAIMACGTGKTLVSIWSAKEMGGNKVIVFVPSLGLMRQVYGEWMKHHHEPNTRYLAVCSDKKIKGSEIEDKLTDSEFPATTDTKTLRKQIEGAKKLVVFCTYQSVEVVTALGMKFDLGIFDEAHKTVGVNDSRSAMALFDRNIKITKRLFMTATPKHHRYAGHKKWENILSMNNEDVYGKRSNELYFSEAKRLRVNGRPVISDFKVIASFITTGDVNRHLLKTHDSRVKSDDVRAIHVANQLAMADAIEKFNLSKIFSFHNSVDSAQDYVRDEAEGFGSHVDGWECLHVNGKQSSGLRQRTLKDFAEAKKAIVSNARCLTEGIDVPAVDCVAFVHPRKSSVDIVQAIGRAMRYKEGKKFGYLLVPIYVEQEEGETIEDALERTDYGKIVAVARAMREHNDELEGLLEIFGVQLGRGGTKQRQPGPDPIEVIARDRINLETLKNAVTTRVLGQLVNTWDVWYGRLQTFKEEHGHANPSISEDPALSRWVGGQRGMKRKGDEGKVPIGYTDTPLTQDRIDKLTKLGIFWEPKEALWEENFRIFKSLTVNIQSAKIDDTVLIKQAVARKWKKPLDKDGLSLDRTHSLKQGWAREKFSEKEVRRVKAWAKKLKTLSDLNKEKHPQQVKYKGSTLTDKRIKRLTDLGFCWNDHVEGWEVMIFKLEKFKKEHGHCIVPLEYDNSTPLMNEQTSKITNGTLGMKVQRSRSGYSAASKKSEPGRNVSKKIKKQLDDLGFAWDAREAQWLGRYELVKVFHKKYGDINLATKGVLEGIKSGVIGGSKEMTQSELDNVDRLLKKASDGGWRTYDGSWPRSVVDEIGMDGIAAYSRTLKARKKLAGWDNHLDDLSSLRIKWKEETRLTDMNPEDIVAVASWLDSLRQQKKNGKLSKDKIDKMNAVGMKWKLLEDAAEKHLNKIRKANSTSVEHFPWGEATAAWLIGQRKLKRKGRLSEYVEDELNKIPDMEWNPITDAWENKFKALREFKDKNNCWPKKVNTDPHGEESVLKTWMNTNQRLCRERKSEKLWKERIKKLKTINFPFAESVHERKWNEKYELAKLYFEDHGHMNVPQLEKPSERSPGGGWVNAQRGKYRKDKAKATLSKDQLKKLEALNIVWYPSDEKSPLRINKYIDNRNNNNATYTINLGKCDRSKLNQVTVTYRTEEQAERALKFLNDQIDKGWNGSNIELRELVYEKICQVPQELTELKEKALNLIKHLKEVQQLGWDKVANELNEEGVATMTGIKWNRSNLIAFYSNNKDE